MFNHLLYIVLFITLLMPKIVMANADPYGNCIKSYDFGGTPSEPVVMAPINPECQSLCMNECQSFSRKNKGGLELNAETIANCLPVCQSGNLYTGYVYEEVSTGNQATPQKLVIRGPFTSSIGCTGVLAASSNIYKSRMEISPGESIKLVMVNAKDANKIYLCGKKIVTLSPIISSLKISDWGSIAVPQTILDDRRDNLCAVQIRDTDWNKVSNRDLWSNGTLWSEDPNKSNYNNMCIWSAKNSYFTNTGIWAKDGDELSISWKSNYIFTTDIELPPGYTFARSSLTKLLQDNRQSNINISKITALLKKQSSLLFMRPGGNINSIGSRSIELMGEGARIANVGDAVDPTKIFPANQRSGSKWFGLKGAVIDFDVKLTTITTAPDCDTQTKRLQNYRACSVVDDPGTPFYMFKGILGSDGTSFSKAPALIALKHFQPQPKPMGYSKGIGGTTVTVEWRGCPFVDGQMLEYAVSTEDLNKYPDKGEWEDIPIGVFQDGDTIPIRNAGSFYLRIKQLAIPEGVPKDMQEYYKNPAHRFGQYYLNLSKADQPTFLQENGIIKQIVNSIRSILYGDQEKKGVTRKLFEALVEQSSVIAAIRTVLVLFIIITGLGYLLGTLQMNQKDMLTRLVKLSFVATVISPTSWDFFANNFFKLFIDGGLELIGDILIGSLGGDNSIIDATNDPASVFSIFDGPFRMMFSMQTWCKVLALIMTGTLGLVVAVFIAISAAFYFLSIVKVVLMFLMSMVMISLLIFMTPLFLCLMLFAQTQSLFTSWWKMLVSFTLQPVALFASISIFNLLIVITLFATLGFTACPSCWFSIYIAGVVDFCLIPTYQILAFSHFPNNMPGFFLPIGTLEAAVLMLILTQGMYRFCEFIANVTNMIVMGGMIHVISLSQYGQGAFDSVESLYGGDDASKRRRNMKRNADAKKQAEKNQNEETNTKNKKRT